MKKYSFLNEFIDPLTLGFIGMSAYGAATGTIGLIKSIFQNKINDQLINKMSYELLNCQDKQSAINLITQYSNSIASQIDQEMSAKNKLNNQKIGAAQYYIKKNFESPLINIINASDDQTWKQKTLEYLTKNVKKQKRIRKFKTAASGVGIGLSAASAATTVPSAGIGVAANVGKVLNAVRAPLATIQYTKFAYSTIKRNLQIFNGQYYINKMVKELNKCPDDDRKMALDIVNKYCFNISNYIDKNIKRFKLNFNPYDDMKNKFYIPLSRIIMDQKNTYWKIKLMDFINENRLTEGISHVANTALQAAMPYLMGRG